MLAAIDGLNEFCVELLFKNRLNWREGKKLAAPELARAAAKPWAFAYLLLPSAAGCVAWALLLLAWGVEARGWRPSQAVFGSDRARGIALFRWPLGLFNSIKENDDIGSATVAAISARSK